MSVCFTAAVKKDLELQMKSPQSLEAARVVKERSLVLHPEGLPYTLRIRDGRGGSDINVLFSRDVVVVKGDEIPEEVFKVIRYLDRCGESRRRTCIGALNMIARNCNRSRGRVSP